MYQSAVVRRLTGQAITPRPLGPIYRPGDVGTCTGCSDDSHSPVKWLGFV